MSTLLHCGLEMGCLASQGRILPRTHMGLNNEAEQIVNLWAATEDINI